VPLRTSRSFPNRSLNDLENASSWEEFFDARQIDSGRHLSNAQANPARSQCQRRRDVIAEHMPFGGHGFFDQFAEPVEQPFVCGFAEVIWRENHRSVESEIKGEFGQVSWFQINLASCPDQQFHSAGLLFKCTDGPKNASRSFERTMVLRLWCQNNAP